MSLWFNRFPIGVHLLEFEPSRHRGTEGRRIRFGILLLRDWTACEPVSFSPSLPSVSLWFKFFSCSFPCPSVKNHKAAETRGGVRRLCVGCFGRCVVRGPLSRGRSRGIVGSGRLGAKTTACRSDAASRGRCRIFPEAGSAAPLPSLNVRDASSGRPADLVRGRLLPFLSTRYPFHLSCLTSFCPPACVESEDLRSPCPRLRAPPWASPGSSGSSGSADG